MLSFSQKLPFPLVCRLEDFISFFSRLLNITILRGQPLDVKMLREVHGWILGLILEITYFSLLVTSFSTEHRPRYHIVAPEGRWMNDPNGPFYDEKQDLYHLFYQYNPYDFHWGNMSWYHMVSKDLISWETLPVALYPDKDYGKTHSAVTHLIYLN